MSAGPIASTGSRNSEYHTRLWMGFLMALAAAGVLVLDHQLQLWFSQPLYPCLLVCTVVIAGLSIFEMHTLLAGQPRPPLWLLLLGGLLLILANWPAHLGWLAAPHVWRHLSSVFSAILLAGFLWEMATFHEPGNSVLRLSYLTWTLAYLGLLPAFLIQLRWWPATADDAVDLRGVAALVLVIFVPKGGDIGAYFTGRSFGRHRMSPLLSPKKTYEGLAGGLVVSALVAVGVQHFLAPLFSCFWEAAAFGVVVGMAGILGDLAESLIKRDCRQKDASHVVPGFGGVLDVIDSVLFAAPVAFWWLRP